MHASTLARVRLGHPRESNELAVGLVVAAVFSTGVAATQQRGYEIIWSLPRRGLRSLRRQLVWVIGLLAAALILSIWLVALSGVIFGGALVGVVIVERRQAS